MKKSFQNFKRSPAQLDCEIAQVLAKPYFKIGGQSDGGDRTHSQGTVPSVNRSGKFKA